VRVLIYEYAAGGGFWSEPAASTPGGALLSQGAAMIRALAADFLKLPGVEVLALRDRRLADWELPRCRITEVGQRCEETGALADLAPAADWTVLIAPETGGALLDRCRLVEAAGGRLLSPGPELVEIASDKHHTGCRLADAGVATPEAILLGDDIDQVQDLLCSFPFPAVIKPRFGAGSDGVRLVHSAEAVRQFGVGGADWRLERYCRGVAASVALLCGPGGSMAMPPARQRLSADGQFRYLGGAAPLEEPLARRAVTLARSALLALPAATGYVGIDLVLGPDPTGGDDRVIEVNPRLTTSYVGLRELARVNLAEAMLAVAQGRSFDASFASRPVVWDADGAVDWPNSPGEAPA
jgi:predicted ATP-grasp superfamily ATP-dependent carboligase